MSNIYIVGVDGAQQSSRAVDFAAALAKKSGAQIHLVQVIEWSPYSFHTPQELAERHGRREQELARALGMVQPLADKLIKEGITATCEARHGHVGDLLCKIATEKNAEQIIIGRTGDSALAQRLLGGVAITLAQAAPVPTTIVP
ncbi:universal stress protein [Sneathiella sp.]|uniref:universal stress protein n=1 Tax=Sneathiella sp. TaxID=1964365 RepID=UPI003562E594